VLKLSANGPRGYMAESKSGGLETPQKINRQDSKHLLLNNSCTQVKTTVLNLCAETVCKWIFQTNIKRRYSRIKEWWLGNYNKKSSGRTANTFCQTTAALAYIRTTVLNCCAEEVCEWILESNKYIEEICIYKMKIHGNKGGLPLVLSVVRLVFLNSPSSL